MALVHKWLLPAGVMAAWFASLFLIEPISGDGNVQAALGFGLTLIAGLLAGRWWVLAIPVVAAIALVVVDVLTPCEDCRDELGLAGAAFLLGLFATAAMLVLALGIGLRKALSLVRESRAPGA